MSVVGSVVFSAGVCAVAMCEAILASARWLGSPRIAPSTPFTTATLASATASAMVSTLVSAVPSPTAERMVGVMWGYVQLGTHGFHVDMHRSHE